MKYTPGLAAIILAFGAVSSLTQVNTNDTSKIRDRVVVTDMLPPAKPAADRTPVPQPTPIVVQSTQHGRVSEGPADVSSDRPDSGTRRDSFPRSFGFTAVKSKIAEAKRMLQTRPLPTASVESTTPLDFVRVAFHDWTTGEIDFVVMSKESFLSTAGTKQLVSQEGKALSARTIRGNGVNTPITLTDGDGINHLPLLVQYPVIREGKYIETAYYMSTHPGLVTPEVVNAGRLYVRNVLDAAREQLRQHGITIQPKIVDIAERLAAVEHVDHLRFRTEFHPNIYNDIYTLFALNEGQTYRYAVSTAGAGGMVQMIPSTYRMVRSWHPNIPLMPDFVEGMRNHLNASKAMLLYMQRTWNDLNSSPAVNRAIASGFATQEHLMAAGYNSNPARLPGYINRGGENWANLIPRETKIYLQIYDSIERHVPMTPRSR
ncbi:MAG TPA: hypothetical protein PKD26_13080 [Pyrinomonadaceae bacterium]|nr:hypothetical protein [Pyrinomonadaceae bacterium]